jgi:hypothetical protein
MKHKRAHPDLSKGQKPPAQTMRHGYDLLPDEAPAQYQTRSTLDELWEDNRDAEPKFAFEKNRI